MAVRRVTGWAILIGLIIANSEVMWTETSVGASKSLHSIKHRTKYVGDSISKLQIQVAT
jgi:hypothetical protein